MEADTLLHNAERHAADIFNNQLFSDLAFHDHDHTVKFVETVKAIGAHEELSSEEMEIAQLIAWFYHTGYAKGAHQFEEKSQAIASDFLSQEKVPQERIDKILSHFPASYNENPPTHPIEKVLTDARQAIAIRGDYKMQVEKLRQASSALQKTEPSKVESLQSYLEVIVKFEFHTAYGKEVLLPERDQLKVKLEKRLNKLQKVVDENLSSDLGVTAAQLKAMKKKLQKAQGRPERGIETMFRLTSKNHLDLSGMADSKANIMISINSIIMSVVMGSLLSKLDSNVHLYFPTVILLMVNLASLIYAILSLRPNVSDGLFTREDIENQKTNLLFFGNFHKMKREDYHWGMNKLMENANFLYSNLIDDIYFLGVVLARKYKLLRTSYNIFMYGMVVVVIAYIISLSFVEEPIMDVLRRIFSDSN